MNLEDLRYCRDDLIMPVWVASSPGRPLTGAELRQIHRAVAALLEGARWSVAERELLQEVLDLSAGAPSQPALSRGKLPLVLNLLKQKIDAQPESAWDALGTLVANAEHAADLKPLLDLGAGLQAGDRESLAQIAGTLIRTAEWPVSWVKPRRSLVRALEDLAPLIDATTPGSAVSRLGVKPSSTLALGSVVLRVVVHLLNAPCPSRELRYLAALCNLVLVPVSDMNRIDLGHLGLAAPPSVVAAREELGAALFLYGEAARTMNDACGEALFNPLLLEP